MGQLTVRKASPAFAALLPLLAACTPPAPAPSPVVVVSFEAAPSAVAAGGTVSLSWETTGELDQVEIFRGAGNIDSLGVFTERAGTLEVANVPAGRTSFELIATGRDGGEVKRQVEVTGVTRPTIAQFKADKTTVAGGSAVVLSWKTALADTVTLSAEGDEVLGRKTGEEAADGALVVRPEATTEYTLVASGLGGMDRVKLTVAVLARPAFSALTVAPGRLLAGQSATLSWATTNADELVVKVAGRTIFTAESSAVASGTRTFVLDQSTVLTTVLTGPGGTVSADRVVTVVPVARFTQFWAEPTDLLLGGEVVLNWESVGVNSVALRANGVEVDLGTHTAPSDRIRLSPPETTLYRLEGSGEGGDASSELLVSVFGMPLISAFESDRSIVFRGREPARLSWATENCTMLSIADDFGNLVETGSQPLAAGTVTVSPNETTNFTLTCVGPGGVVQSTLPAAITVDDPFPLVTLSLARSQVIFGETTELSWTIEDQTSFTLEALTNGSTAPVAIDTTGKSGVDVISLPIPSDTTVYTLRAVGARPDLVTARSVTLSVVKLPAFTVFTSNRLVSDASGERVVVTAGQPYDVTWATTDATSVEFVPTTLASDTDPFISIKGQPGTRLITGFSSLDDSSVITEFPEGFGFPFYTGTFNRAEIHTNGFLCLGGTVAECGTGNRTSNVTIPGTATPNNFIAPFWDDLAGNESTQILLQLSGTSPRRRLVYEWNGTDVYSSSGSGTPLTFQVVLFEDGDWEIRHQPRATPTTNFMSGDRYGASATIGIEGPGGTAGMLASFNSTSALCASFTPGTATTPPACSPLTRIRPLKLGTSGTVTLTAAGAGDVFLKMRANGPVGSTMSPDLLVRVVPPATANELTVARVPSSSGTRPTATHIGAGEVVNLFYSVGPSLAVARRFGISNGAGDEPGVVALSGVVAVQPAATTTYTLYAENEAVDRTTKQVTVTVGPPTATFGATALPKPADGSDRLIAPAGDSFEFRWQTTGARRLWIEAPDGQPVFPALSWDTTAEQARITAGTHVVTVTQSGVYKLKVANGPSGSEAVVERSVTLDIATDLRVVSFASNLQRQTEGRNVTLSWETFNANAVSITSCPLTSPTACDDETSRTELTGMPLTANIRFGNWPAPVGAATTRFHLRARGLDGTWSAPSELTVVSVPMARIDLFAATRPTVNWNERTTLAWAVANATALKLYSLTGAGATAVLGTEIRQAANQLPSGTVELTLVKSSGYRLVATNELGTETVRDLDPPITVNVEPPTISFSADPGESLPSGGAVTLTWSASQGESIYLWQREPESVVQGASVAAAGTEPARTEAVNIPYDFVPYDFVDISATGAAIDFKAAASGTSTVTNLESGRAFIDLPSDFNPHFLGEDVGRMMVTTEGALFLAPDTAAQLEADFDTVCRTSSCSPVSVASSTSITARKGVYPFWAPLAACRGWTTATPTCGTAGRSPGAAYWQVVGAAPNRVLVVQWDRWDANSGTNEGVLTFEAKLFENGDVEFQYKTLQSLSTAFGRGGGAVVGIDSRYYKSSPINYFHALGNFSSFLGAGDGYRIYSGRRPASGSLRSFYATTVSEGTPAASRFPFRAVVINSRATDNRQTVRAVPLRVPGQNDLYINELMIDPESGDDVNKEWIELRNTSSTAAADLTNFVLQTSSGSFTFPGGTIPAGGLGVFGQTLVTALNGGVPLDLAYGTSVQLDDLSDSVILRFGNVLIDRVEYDAQAGWRVPSGGQSLALDVSVPGGGSHLLNDVPSAWCGGRDPAGAVAGMVSTPGAPNAGCLGFERIAYDPQYDISTESGVTVVLSVGHSDDTTASTPLLLPGFSLFGGAAESVLQVNANGWVALRGVGSGTSFGNVVTLPSTSDAANDGLYAFWDDLAPISGRGRTITKLIGTAPNRAQVIMFDGYQNYSGNISGTDYSFMVVLKEDNTVEYHYKSLTGANADGRSTTIGFEANGNSLGAVYSASTGSTPPTPPLSAAPFGLRPRRFQ
jgi:hypothetical protein